MSKPARPNPLVRSFLVTGLALPFFLCCGVANARPADIAAPAIADSAGVPSPPAKPAPAPVDSTVVPPPAPTDSTVKPVPVPIDSTVKPVPGGIGAGAAVGGAAVGAAVSTPAPAKPLTKKQQRAADKQAKKNAKKTQKAEEEKHPPSDPWSKRAQWLSLRAGYAKSGEVGSANGNVGFGVGYSRFLNHKWAAGAYLHGDVLGKFGAAAELEAPLTFELVRHFMWQTAAHPYFGMGAGWFHRKLYRTGDDSESTNGGYYFVGGINIPVAAKRIFGFDVRTEFVKGNLGETNPVFGTDEKTLIHYSAKFSYSLMF